MESTTWPLIEYWMEDRNEYKRREGEREGERSWFCHPDNRDERKKKSQFSTFGLSGVGSFPQRQIQQRVGDVRIELKQKTPIVRVCSKRNIIACITVSWFSFWREK